LLQIFLGTSTIAPDVDTLFLKILMTNSKSSKSSKGQHAEEGDSRTTHTPDNDSEDGRGMYYPLYPGRWARIRANIREPAAEFLGTMILIIFGTGVNCQVGDMPTVGHGVVRLTAIDPGRIEH